MDRSTSGEAYVSASVIKGPKFESGMADDSKDWYVELRRWIMLSCSKDNDRTRSGQGRARGASRNGHGFILNKTVPVPYIA
jgi:hypothetical protein